MNIGRIKSIQKGFKYWTIMTSNDNDDRAKQYARLILFVFILIVIWYGLDLASVSG